MKRALAVFSVLAVLGFSAFGIGTFSGKWDATILLIGTGAPKITANTLTLNYTDFGWTFTGVLSLTGATGTPGDVFKFSAKGAFGPLSITGNEWFDYTNAAWMGGDLASSLDFAGVSVGLGVRHWDKDYAGYFFSATDSTKPWYPDTDPCQTYEYGMMYILTAKVAPIDLKVRFVDCCQGIMFYDTVISLSDIGLCCGISLDVELKFTKSGFNYLDISGIEIPLCCGVSLTAGVEFTTSGKALSTGLKFAGFGDACFTVYGDAIEGGTPVNQWLGIAIHGYKIKCSLGDCNYVEFGTALDATGRSKLGLTAPEFEYMKLNFCGAGCCGGQYNVAISIYFVESGKLFGINRLGATMSIPVMSNFTAKVTFDTTPSLKIGWTFTF
jgi:hypothetical protein